MHQADLTYHQLNVEELLQEMHLEGILHQGLLDGKELLVAGNWEFQV